MLETTKEELAEQIYEKFVNLTYNVKGDYCDDTISTLSLEVLSSNYIKKCKKIICHESF